MGNPAQGGRPEGVDRDHLSFEGTTARAIAEQIGSVPLVGRIQVMGSLALSLCHLAAGGVDAVCSLKPARSVDVAAARLLVRERGLSIELFDDPPFSARPPRPDAAVARRRGQVDRAHACAGRGAEGTLVPVKLIVTRS